MYTNEYVELCDRALATHPVTAGTQMKETEFSPGFLHKCAQISKVFSEEICISVVLPYVAVLLRQLRPCFLMFFLLFFRLLHN